MQKSDHRLNSNAPYTPETNVILIEIPFDTCDYSNIIFHRPHLLFFRSALNLSTVRVQAASARHTCTCGTRHPRVDGLAVKSRLAQVRLGTTKPFGVYVRCTVQGQELYSREYPDVGTSSTVPTRRERVTVEFGKGGDTRASKVGRFCANGRGFANFPG